MHMKRSPLAFILVSAAMGSPLRGALERMQDPETLSGALAKLAMSYFRDGFESVIAEDVSAFFEDVQGAQLRRILEEQGFSTVSGVGDEVFARWSEAAQSVQAEVELAERPIKFTAVLAAAPLLAARLALQDDDEEENEYMLAGAGTVSDEEADEEDDFRFFDTAPKVLDNQMLKGRVARPGGRLPKRRKAAEVRAAARRAKELPPAVRMALTHIPEEARDPLIGMVAQLRARFGD